MNAELLIENIKRICKVKGTPPTNACIESGAGKSFISDMKRGQIPSVAKVQLLADYLGVTTSELLGEKKPAAPDGGSRPNEIDSIFENLTPDNQSKLLELARLYLAAQSNDKEKK